MFGVLLVLLGASQAELARAFALDLSQSGFLGAVLALGLGGGVLLGGPIADRFSHRPLFVVSSLIAGAGLLSASESAGYYGLVALLLSIGIGCGLYETAINLSVVKSDTGRSAAALALVHSAATLGACIGPLIIRWVLARGHWTDAFHLLGSLHCALAGWGLFGKGFVTRSKTTVAVQPSAARVITPPLLALCVVAYAYVGIESALTVFALPWSQSLAEPESAGQWSISSLWTGLLLGRLALAARPVQRGARLLAAAGCVSTLILAVSSELALRPLTLVMGLTGAVLGPDYPLLIVIVAGRFPAQSGTAVGLVAAAGAMGGFVVPWLTGALGDAFGVQHAMALLSAHGLALSAAALALLRRDKRGPVTAV
ncbi:MAG TPA: MFS transporter [Polyangiales bacterium]|nr:MFS transporter [Polyangiales bacterium]